MGLVMPVPDTLLVTLLMSTTPSMDAAAASDRCMAAPWSASAIVAKSCCASTSAAYCADAGSSMAFVLAKSEGGLQEAREGGNGGGERERGSKRARAINLVVNVLLAGPDGRALRPCGGQYVRTSTAFPACAPPHTRTMRGSVPHECRLRAAASAPQRGHGRPAPWERQRRGKGIRAARQPCRAPGAGMGRFPISTVRRSHAPAHAPPERPQRARAFPLHRVSLASRGKQPEWAGTSAYRQRPGLRSCAARTWCPCLPSNRDAHPAGNVCRSARARCARCRPPSARLVL